MNRLSSTVTALAVAISLSSVANAATRYEELANQPFEKGFPTEATARCLIDELVFQRYVQSYLWA